MNPVDTDTAVKSTGTGLVEDRAGDIIETAIASDHEVTGARAI